MGIVGNYKVIADKVHDAGQCPADRRRVCHHVICNTRKLGNKIGDRVLGLYERLISVGYFVAPHTQRGKLDDIVISRVKPGRLKVKHYVIFGQCYDAVALIFAGALWLLRSNHHFPGG